jgi:hypothetical protein
MKMRGKKRKMREKGDGFLLDDSLAFFFFVCLLLLVIIFSCFLCYLWTLNWVRKWVCESLVQPVGYKLDKVL